MNTQSIASSFSPFRFLPQQFKRLNPIHASERLPVDQLKPDNRHRLSTENPHKLLENQLVKALEKVFGAERVLSSSTGSEALSPEKVAGRVLQFINQAYGQLQHSAPDFDEAGFFSEIKQAIETGFNEASETLDELGLSAGPVKDELDATYAAIQNGLSQLASGSQTATVSSTQLQGFSAELNRSAAIEIVTREGDTIKINFEQSASVARSSATLEQDGLIANASQSSFTESGAFSVTIEGNLNEDEQQALKKLLQQMREVEQHFYDGHFQAAFHHAQKIGLDTEQIASFSMSLSMEKSIQAVAAYQQTAFPDQPIEPEKIKQAADFFTQAGALLKTAASALEPFANPSAAFETLFNVVSQVGAEKSTELKSDNETLSLQQIIQRLGETASPGEKPVQLEESIET